MCQMSRPGPGSDASKPVCCRFSSRKHSLPAAPFFHSRCTVLDVFTSATLSAPFAVRLSIVTQPWLALHQADGWVGTSPPPPQLPPAMRHQLPIPSDE